MCICFTWLKVYEEILHQYDNIKKKIVQDALNLNKIDFVLNLKPNCDDFFLCFWFCLNLWILIRIFFGKILLFSLHWVSCITSQSNYNSSYSSSILTLMTYLSMYNTDYWVDCFTGSAVQMSRSHRALAKILHLVLCRWSMTCFNLAEWLLKT